MKPNQNISDPGRPGLDDAQLLAYLEGRLPEADQKAIEAYLSAADATEREALEGLKTLGAAEVRRIQNRLNRALWKSVRNRRRRRGLGTQPGNLIALTVLLLLAVACLLVFWLLLR
ncbi:MAG: hypothetical protein JST06_08015 [Bacteroidetes bacterium]|nr:hypothetical protein [Bacteroidota bacterium]MBS1630718.1 hypothetical protein [Bacteroidota bacterium]